MGHPRAPGADALVDLCTNYADAEPVRRAKPHVVVHVPLEGPAEVDGIAIAETTLAEVMADAVISTAVIDANTICGTRTDGDDIPEAVKRFVRQRDQHCRVGTCDETEMSTTTTSSRAAKAAPTTPTTSCSPAAAAATTRCSSRTGPTSSTATPAGPTAYGSCTATSSPRRARTLSHGEHARSPQATRSRDFPTDP